VAQEIVVVTGGARGIGLAICRRVTQAGARAVIVDMDGTRAEAAAAEVGSGAVAMPCDVTNVGQVRDLLKQVEATCGTCTALVSNVGWTPDKPFLDTTLEEQARIIDVNYAGSLHVTRAFLPHMKAASFGRIVYVSSDAARVGVAGEAVYAGAKAALIGFAKSLAVEVARNGITVNVVCPGSTDTPLLNDLFTPEQIAKRIKIHPMRRLAQPEDVASAVNYFISDEAGFVTGQVISVSGGMLRVG
jgi:2-hydroxycyclohexanecarboxyl-CoA dehydrogenase